MTKPVSGTGLLACEIPSRVELRPLVAELRGGLIATESFVATNHFDLKECRNLPHGSECAYPLVSILFY